MGASTDAPSAYLRSKAKGEEVIRQEQTLRIRLSGLRWFLARGILLSISSPRWRDGFRFCRCPGSYGVLQPIAVDDLARMIAGVVEDEGYNGKTLLAGGAEVVSLRELVSLVVEALGTRCAVVPLGEFSSRVFAAVVDLLPFVYVFTGDNFNSLRVPSVTPKEGNDAEKILGRLTGLTEGNRADACFAPRRRAAVEIVGETLGLVVAATRNPAADFCCYLVGGACARPLARP